MSPPHQPAKPAPAVLIIDDEVTLARNLAAYLRRVGYDVRTAACAEEGLATLADFLPAIVLCDHDLPGMNGLEAMREIRQRHGTLVRVVMVSGSSSHALAAAALQAGAAHFLTKPVALADVRLLLERLVGG